MRAVRLSSASYTFRRLPQGRQTAWLMLTMQSCGRCSVELQHISDGQVTCYRDLRSSNTRCTRHRLLCDHWTSSLGWWQNCHTATGFPEQLCTVRNEVASCRNHGQRQLGAVVCGLWSSTVRRVLRAFYRSSLQVENTPDDLLMVSDRVGD